MTKVVNEETAVAIKEQHEVSTEVEVLLGYEDEDQSDIIIPRVKMIQSLSPERKDKTADEGDIINSLTLEKLNGSNFIPIFKFSNNIDWIPRDEGGGFKCKANDGKRGVDLEGNMKLCKQCKRNEFDNTKQGKDAFPQCTKYMNFFGFVEGQAIPIILSFAKTNYGEGKKLFSLCKVTMQNMFNHKYTFVAKEMKRNGNEWFNIDITQAGPTTKEERQRALDYYHNFKDLQFKYDEEESSREPNSASDEASEEEVANAEI